MTLVKEKEKGVAKRAEGRPRLYSNYILAPNIFDILFFASSFVLFDVTAP
jgi:hypothetical protein